MALVSACCAGIGGAGARALGWDSPPPELVAMDGALLSLGALALGLVLQRKLDLRLAHGAAAGLWLGAYAAENLLRGHAEPALGMLLGGFLLDLAWLRWGARGLALFSALALAAAGAEGRAQERHAPRGTPRSSLLFIVVDTLRRDHMSLYGYTRQTTPEIDRFATAGRVYTNALAAAPHTMPSHASMFTGLYARSHGVHLIRTAQGSEIRGLHPSFSTLAELAHSAGVHTGAIASNFSTGANGLEQGFDFWATPAPDTWPRFTPSDRLLALLTPDRGWYARYPILADAGMITDEAKHWLESNGDQRFFLFLNFMDVHQPTWRRAGEPAPQDPGEDGYDQLSVTEAMTALADPARGPGLRAALNNRYDRHLRAADAEIGGLLRWMQERGLLEDTTVILTSDHGEYLGEYGYAFHPLGLHAEVLEVPLIIRGPRVISGRDPRPTSGVDLFVAGLEALDLRVPPGVDGRSLREPAGLQVAELHSQFQPDLLEPPWAATFDRRFEAIRVDDFHYILASDGESWGYAVGSGPGEDLCAQGDPRCADARSRLDAWRSARPYRGAEKDGVASPLPR